MARIRASCTEEGPSIKLQLACFRENSIPRLPKIPKSRKVSKRRKNIQGRLPYLQPINGRYVLTARITCPRLAPLWHHPSPWQAGVYSPLRHVNHGEQTVWRKMLNFVYILTPPTSHSRQNLQNSAPTLY
jgi:hypothetical protein